MDARPIPFIIRHLAGAQRTTPLPRPIFFTSTTRHQSTSTTPPLTFSSIDPSEISHFNTLASSWWDPYGPSRPLHLMNPLRHNFIRACHGSQPIPLTPTTQSLRYLDIGCGGGIFAESAARLPTTKSVTAIDPTPKVLAIAQAHAKRDPGLAGKLTYRQATIEDLPVPKGDRKGEREGQFDVVSIFEVIEHVDRPAPFLDCAAPFVKPGGWLVMSTIARTWVSWFITNLMAEDILKIVPKGTHDWEKYLNAEEMSAYFSSRGIWETPQVMGVMYMPGLGWKQFPGGEKVGNYFIAVRKREDAV